MGILKRRIFKGPETEDASEVAEMVEGKKTPEVFVAPKEAPKAAEPVKAVEPAKVEEKKPEEVMLKPEDIKPDMAVPVTVVLPGSMVIDLLTALENGYLSPDEIIREALRDFLYGDGE